MSLGDREWIHRAERVPALFGVDYDSPHRTLSGRTCDLSMSGAFIATPQQDAPGTDGRLRFNSYLAKEPVEVPCVVARVGEAPRQGMGVRFTTLSSVAEELLRHYIARFSDTQRVVMVEDEVALLRMMDRVVVRAGLQFVGVEAPLYDHEALVRLRPGLLILDVMMPGVNGFTLARRVRAHPEGAGIPMLFYSALSGDDVPDDLRDIPFLQKGLPARDTVAAIRTRLGAGAVAQDGSSSVR